MAPRLLRILLPLLAVLASHVASAQIDAAFSQYYEVPQYYNSGAIGTTEYIRVRAGSRMQWIGIDNAPRTFTAAAEMPLKLFNKRFGLGLVLNQESIGLYRTMELSAQAAYKLKLLGGSLSLGLSLGFIDQSFKGSEVYIPDDDDYHEGSDEAIPKNDLRGNAFDIGIGAWYVHPKFWAGVSITHANSPSISLSSEQSAGSTEAQEFEFQAGRTFYFMAGSNIAIKNTLFEVMPSLIVRSDLTFTTAEITGRVKYNKFLTAGLGYRYKDAIVLSVGAEYRDFFLGYSYDYPTGAIAKASSGSHEVFFGYRHKLNMGDKNRHKHKNIRIM